MISLIDLFDILRNILQVFTAIMVVVVYFYVKHHK